MTYRVEVDTSKAFEGKQAASARRCEAALPSCTPFPVCLLQLSHRTVIDGVWHTATTTPDLGERGTIRAGDVSDGSKAVSKTLPGVVGEWDHAAKGSVHADPCRLPSLVTRPAPPTAEFLAAWMHPSWICAATCALVYLLLPAREHHHITWIPWKSSFRYILFHEKKTPNDAVTPQC